MVMSVETFRSIIRPEDCCECIAALKKAGMPDQ